MTDAPALKVGMPLDEYLEQLTTNPFDMIDGERIPWMPNVALPTWIIRLIYDFMRAYGIQHQNGEAFFETTYILPENYNSKWVTNSLTPDVMFIKESRLTEYRQNTPDWKAMPYAIIPDVVVEVISPTDKYADVATKIERYQTDGVPLIWIVNPKSETISIYTPDRSKVTVLSKEDTLTGGDVLPDFSLAVADIFDV